MICAMPWRLDCTRPVQSNVSWLPLGFVPPVQPFKAAGAHTCSVFGPNTVPALVLHEQLQAYELMPPKKLQAAALPMGPASTPTVTVKFPLKQPLHAESGVPASATTTTSAIRAAVAHLHLSNADDPARPPCRSAFPIASSKRAKRPV
jgi:hypothetical protein